MSLLPHNEPRTREPSPPFDEWPQEKKDALYDFASNLDALRRFGAWTASFAVFVAALVTICYYVIAILSGHAAKIVAAVKGS